jgi:hypothetical protein
MADYGTYYALKGFLGTGEKKMQMAQQNMQNLAQEESLDLQRQNQNIQYAQLESQYYQQTDELINNLTVRGQDDVRELATKLQSEMREDLARHNNNYGRWLANGGVQKLAQYKQTILQSDEYKNHATTKKTLGYIQEATLNNQGHLIPQATQLQMRMYQDGLTDVVNWNGLLGEVDTDGLEKTIALGQQATADDILSYNNNHAILTYNYLLEQGMTEADLLTMSKEEAILFNTGFRKYVEQNVGSVPGIAKAEDFAGVGKRSAAQDFNLALVRMPSLTYGYDINSVLETDANANAFANVLGLDVENNPMYDTNWWSDEYRVVGYGIANSLHDALYSAEFGTAYAKSAATEDDPGRMRVKGLNAEGLYDDRGRKVQDAGVVDANVVGVYLTYKNDNVKDMDSDYSGSMLMTEKINASEKDIQKMREAGQGTEFAPTMVIQLQGDDGKIYFKEVSRSAISTAMADKELDITSEYENVLSTQVQQKNSLKQEASYNDITYSKNMSKYYNQLATQFKIPQNMQNAVLAMAINFAKKGGAVDETQVANNMNSALYQYIPALMQNPQISQAILSGDLNQLYSYLSQTSQGKKLVSEIKKTTKNITSEF